MFAKLKTLFRKAEARTREASWKTLATLLDAFKPKECANVTAQVSAAAIRPA